jgi:hypothetical protein
MVIRMWPDTCASPSAIRGAAAQTPAHASPAVPYKAQVNQRRAISNVRDRALLKEGRDMGS